MFKKVLTYSPPRRQAQDLSQRKKELLKELLFMETTLVRGDFQYFVKLTQARAELKRINEKLDSVAMKCYLHTFKNEI